MRLASSNALKLSDGSDHVPTQRKSSPPMVDVPERAVLPAEGLTHGPERARDAVGHRCRRRQRVRGLVQDREPAFRPGPLGVRRWRLDEVVHTALRPDGTCAKVLLPYAIPRSRVPPARMRRLHALEHPRDEAADPSAKSILVVEDDRGLRLALTRLLGEDFQVDDAADGTEALASTAESCVRPACCSISALPGHERARRARATSGRTRLTENRRNDRRRHAADTAARRSRSRLGYIVKPFPPATITDM